MKLVTKYQDHTDMEMKNFVWTRRNDDLRLQVPRKSPVFGGYL